MTSTGRAVLLVLVGYLPISSTVFAHGRGVRIGLVARDGVALYARPSTRAPILAHVVQQTQVSVTVRRNAWDQVAIWSGVTGWMRRHDIVFRRPWVAPSTYRAPVARTRVHVHGAVTIDARGTILRATRSAASILLPVGRKVRVTAWRQDRTGTVWYRVRKIGWIPGGDVRFDAAHGRPRAWQVVTGKGMWLTLGTMADTAPSVLISAAHRAGVTHLFLESAISPLGFHGRDVVGPVLEAAHRAHLEVLAWVYPYLLDVGADLDLTHAVAHFTSLNGQHFDGIAVDLERNLFLARVRAYSQIARAELPWEPLIAVTYPPQSLPSFPFAEIAWQYDAIAPMDYWHDSRSGFGTLYGHLRYGEDYARRYAADSVSEIRALTGPFPIVPIGQTFDNFGRLEMGPYAPSRSEIRGFLLGCKQSGAPGASFFQWMTATQPEWHAISTFRY